MYEKFSNFAVENDTTMTPYDLAYEYVMHTNRCIF